MVEAQICEERVAQVSLNRLQVHEETHDVIFGKLTNSVTVIFLM
jgi:hypothetical protein